MYWIKVMKQSYLIGYDIADTKRLVRIYRCLKKHAIPIQYSLFLGLLTGSQLMQVIEDVEFIINPKRDDVRFYLLPQNYWSRRCGRAVLPAGLIYTDLPEDWTSLSRECHEAVVAPNFTVIPADKPQSSGRQAQKIQNRIQTGQRKGILLIR